MAKYIDKPSGQYTGHQHTPEGISVDNPVTPSTDVNPTSQDRPKEQFMNKTVGKFLGKVNNAYDKVMYTPLGERLTMGELNKGWRGLILLNRALGRPFDPISSSIDTVKELPGKAISLIKKGTTPFPGSTQGDLDSSIQASRKISPPDSSHTVKRWTWFPEDATESKENWVEDKYSNRNSVLIINPCLLDANGNPDYVELQVRPNTIDYQPKSTWADIYSMGRNTPMYHYTGSETSLQFNTSWYMPFKPGDPEFNLYWVINQCRKLESWTMANGYMNAPPYLLIRWGDSDLFSEHLWILHSATYKLQDFRDILKLRNREFISVEGGESYTREDPTKSPLEVNQGLVPFSATQELIFKRVSGINLWYSEIAPQLQSLKTDYHPTTFNENLPGVTRRSLSTGTLPQPTLSTETVINSHLFPSDPTLNLT